MLQKVLEKEFLERFPGQEEIISRIIGFAHSLLENTKGGLLAGVGVVILFWAATKVLGHIEHSFGDIWGVKEQRTIGRRFSDYLSILIVCPLLLIVASSANVFIATQIKLITEKIVLLGTLSPIIFFIVKLIPFFFIWAFLTFIYIFMPNTKVRFLSGVIPGILAGTIFGLLQSGYINFQVWTAKYNAIYGSFAALPLLLMWLQISWLIILFGAEYSFAYQNVDNYEFEPDSSEISFSFKKSLCLQISHLVIKNFCNGARPLSAEDISQTLDLPMRLTRSSLYELVESGVFSEVRMGKNRETFYQPARDVNTLSVHHIIEALEHKGNNDIHVAQTDALKTLSETLQTFRNTVEKSPANRLLKDL